MTFAEQFGSLVMAIGVVAFLTCCCALLVAIFGGADD
jgi:hypothetical protein